MDRVVDKIAAYRQIIQGILAKYTKIPYAYGEMAHDGFMDALFTLILSTISYGFSGMIRTMGLSISWSKRVSQSIRLFWAFMPPMFAHLQSMRLLKAKPKK